MAPTAVSIDEYAFMSRTGMAGLWSLMWVRASMPPKRAILMAINMTLYGVSLTLSMASLPSSAPSVESPHPLRRI